MTSEPFLHVARGGPADGLTFEITLPLDKGIWTGTYELAFASAIARHIKPGDICYDIGGYRGYMSGVMAHAGASKVYIFEPLPKNQSALRRLAELNPGLPLELVPFALANSDGSMLFKIMPDASMGKLSTSAFQPDAVVMAEISVEIMKLDSVIREKRFAPPNVIKIDVEGAEMDVLLGAEQVLRKGRPRMFIEAHSAQLKAECTKFLSNLGYSIQLLEKNKAPGQEGVYHLVCLPS
jgi:FkbM family methyltransferase